MCGEVVVYVCGGGVCVCVCGWVGGGVSGVCIVCVSNSMGCLWYCPPLSPGSVSWSWIL